MKQLLILITLILAGCSAQKKETGATFKVGIRSLTAAGTVSEFPGGLMLFGKTTGRSFGRIMAASSQDEMIPNGVWDFYVIGWDGSGLGTPMTGKVYCALQTGVALNGDPVEINLKATNANCAAPVFGGVYVDGNGDNHFPKINIETCNSIDAVTASTTCEYITTSAATYNKTKGAALSYAIMASAYDKVGPDFRVFEGVTYRSGCSRVSGLSDGALSDNKFVTEDLNIPSGTSGSPFAFNLRAYFGSNSCQDELGHINIPLVHGAKPASQRAVGLQSPTDSEVNIIFTKVTEADVCAWTGPNRSVPFRGGLGSVGLPYVICNGAELNKIGSTYYNKNFILGRDIDMNPYTAALNSGMAPPCSEGGENFYPIGGGYYTESASDPASTCVSAFPSTYDAFTGVFDGNNKVVKGLRLQKEGDEDVAFIRKLDGGKLINIKFKNIELRGDTNVGIIGSTDAPAQREVAYNIEVLGGEVESRTGYSGALAALALKNSEFKNIFISEVSLQGADVGGVVGQLGPNSKISKASFKGFINSENGIYGSGGIVAEHSGSLIDQVSSRGAISGKAMFVGGIAGKAYSNISNSYSYMYLTSEKSGATVGGLAGNASGSVATSYFAGQVYCPGCSSVGEIDGNRTVSGDFYANSQLPGSPAGTVLDETTLLGTSILNSAPWINKSGAYPMLAFEQERLPCSNNSASDKLICTVSEFTSFLNNNKADENWTLGESLSVGTIVPKALFGSLDGQGNILTNANWSGADKGVFSLIESGAEVRDLNLLGAVFGNSTSDNVGLLTVHNKGLVERVFVGGEVLGGNTLGLIAAKNTGVIRKSAVDGSIKGVSEIGGIVAQNESVIELCSSDVNIKTTAVAQSSLLGGLVANNSTAGKILKSSSEAEIDTVNGSYDTVGTIGLMAGSNYGSISNSYVGNGKITLNGINANSVGGFVGLNDGSGSVDNSYSLGRVVVLDNNHNVSFGGFLGSGTNAISNSFFLFDPLSKLFEAQADLSCSEGTQTLSVVNAANDLGGISFENGDYLIGDHGRNVFIHSAGTSFTLSGGTTANNFSIAICHEDLNRNVFFEIMRSGAPNINPTGTSWSDLSEAYDITDYTGSGWDIAEFTGSGAGHNEDQLLNYYKAIVNGIDPLTDDDPGNDPPVWEFNQGEAPRLVELER